MVYNKKILNELDVSGKTVFLRLDLNVPVDNGVITSYKRINATLPTIKYLLDNNAKIVILSHFGRPKTIEDIQSGKFSLEIVARALASKIGNYASEISFISENKGPEVNEKIASLKEKAILVLENTRFNDIGADGSLINFESESNDDLSKYWAGLCDVYVNDAYGAAHRNHASTNGIAKYQPNNAIGFLMNEELKTLTQIVENPIRPFTVIFGGAKVSDKSKAVEATLKTADKVIISGGMAYTFLAAQGYDMGLSKVEYDFLDEARRLLAEYPEKLVISSDFLCSPDFSDTQPVYLTKEDGLSGYMGLDIGEKSIKEFEEVINASNSILWNGPMGVTEFSNYTKGTNAICDAIAKRTELGAFTVIGGGDSAAAAEKLGKQNSFSWISTGGGASLVLIEGKPLAGIDSIEESLKKKIIINKKRRILEESNVEKDEVVDMTSNFNDVYESIFSHTFKDDTVDVIDVFEDEEQNVITQRLINEIYSIDKSNIQEHTYIKNEDESQIEQSSNDESLVEDQTEDLTYNEIQEAVEELENEILNEVAEEIVEDEIAEEVIEEINNDELVEDLIAEETIEEPTEEVVEEEIIEEQPVEEIIDELVEDEIAEEIAEEVINEEIAEEVINEEVAEDLVEETEEQIEEAIEDEIVDEAVEEEIVEEEPVEEIIDELVEDEIAEEIAEEVIEDIIEEEVTNDVIEEEAIEEATEEEIINEETEEEILEDEISEEVVEEFLEDAITDELTYEQIEEEIENFEKQVEEEVIEEIEELIQSDLSEEEKEIVEELVDEAIETTIEEIEEEIIEEFIDELNKEEIEETQDDELVIEQVKADEEPEQVEEETQETWFENTEADLNDDSYIVEGIDGEEITDEPLTSIEEINNDELVEETAEEVIEDEIVDEAVEEEIVEEEPVEEIIDELVEDEIAEEIAEEVIEDEIVDEAVEEEIVEEEPVEEIIDELVEDEIAEEIAEEVIEDIIEEETEKEIQNFEQEIIEEITEEIIEEQELGSGEVISTEEVEEAPIQELQYEEAEQEKQLSKSDDEEEEYVPNIQEEEEEQKTFSQSEYDEPIIYSEIESEIIQLEPEKEEKEPEVVELDISNIKTQKKKRMSSAAIKLKNLINTQKINLQKLEKEKEGKK